jgi:hypothetical protein
MHVDAIGCHPERAQRPKDLLSCHATNSRSFATLRMTWSLSLVLATTAGAQVRVNPTGVSVSSMAATTVFLTFGGLRDQQPVDAYWCGEIISAAPARGTRCDPSTLYGKLPLRYDLSQLRGGSFTDIMSIPPSVVRLAYQAAQRGATSTFFYVRRFQSVSGGPDEYVAVTCRLTGGGARVPFSLTDVRLEFDGDEALPFIAPGESPPTIAARIAYTGTGRLIGRWEIVLPGEEPPTSRDLLTEATLPLEQRGSQRRFTQLERFNVFLTPDGQVTLPGPDTRKLPSAAEGTYRILLRVEAIDDREGDSNLADAGAGVGTVHSGAVAGFSLPVLRYVVAGPGARTRVDDPSPLRLLSPRDADTLSAASPFSLLWSPSEGVVPDFYRVDLETQRGEALLSALLPRTARRYEVPAWLATRAGDRAIRWRVIGLAADGTHLRSSAWRSARFVNTVPAGQANKSHVSPR